MIPTTPIVVAPAVLALALAVAAPGASANAGAPAHPGESGGAQGGFMGAGLWEGWRGHGAGAADTLRQRADRPDRTGDGHRWDDRGAPFGGFRAHERKWTDRWHPRSNEGSPRPVPVPEMDAAAGTQALALLGGILLLMGERRRRARG